VATSDINIALKEKAPQDNFLKYDLFKNIRNPSKKAP